MIGREWSAGPAFRRYMELSVFCQIWNNEIIGLQLVADIQHLDLKCTFICWIEFLRIWSVPFYAGLSFSQPDAIGCRHLQNISSFCNLIIAFSEWKRSCLALFSTFSYKRHLGMIVLACIFHFCLSVLFFIYCIKTLHRVMTLTACMLLPALLSARQIFIGCVGNWSDQWQLRNFSHPITHGVSSHPLVPKPAALRPRDWCCIVFTS